MAAGRAGWPATVAGAGADRGPRRFPQGGRGQCRVRFRGRTDPAATGIGRGLPPLCRTNGAICTRPANIAAFSEDADADNILALERWDPDAGKATKAAIFTERLVTPNMRPDKADSAVDALAIALRETGQVDFARMIELTEKPQAELVEELAGKIFLDPATGHWVTADEYLSGNVRHKLHVAEANGLDDNAHALREVLPRDVGPKEIFAQLGAPWIPVEVVEVFINQHLFQAGDGYGNRVGVKYLTTLGYWKLDTSDAYRLRVFGRE